MDQVSSPYRLVADKLAEWVEAPPAAPPSWSAETWACFKTGCQAHGVASLLCARHEELRAWPVEVVAWIEHQHARNRQRIARMAEELAAILGRFELGGLRVMPLKGLYVAELAYRDVTLRPMNDLDLLLAPEDFEAGERLLAELGYEKVFAGWKHTKFAKPGNRRIVDLDCEHPDNPRPVEVHPCCVEKIREQRIDLTGQAWASAAIGPLLGREAWLMGSDVLWVYLLIHATHHMLHNNFRLIQLVDLTRLGSVVRPPRELLSAVDARGTIAPLVLLQRYFPSPDVAALLGDQRDRVTASFAAWADSLDLHEVSHLNPTAWRV